MKIQSLFGFLIVDTNKVFAPAFLKKLKKTKCMNMYAIIISFAISKKYLYSV